MPNKFSLKVFICIFLSEILDSGAQVMMRKGLLSAHTDFSNVAGILGFLFHNGSSYWVWTGLLVYSLNFFVWMIVLSQLELSMAVPLTSLNYLLLPLLALIFLGEKISALRWLGVLLIIGGVCIVSQSTRPRPEKQSVA